MPANAPANVALAAIAIGASGARRDGRASELSLGVRQHGATVVDVHDDR